MPSKRTSHITSNLSNYLLLLKTTEMNSINDPVPRTYKTQFDEQV